MFSVHHRLFTSRLPITSFHLSPLVHSSSLLFSYQTQAKKRSDDLDFNVLKQAQGIHAPLRLMMERKLCKDIGRLPFLPSSNLMLEVLEGRQDDLDFSDFFRGMLESDASIK